MARSTPSRSSGAAWCGEVQRHRLYAAALRELVDGAHHVLHIVLAELMTRSTFRMSRCLTDMWAYYSCAARRRQVAARGRSASPSYGLAAVHPLDSLGLALHGYGSVDSTRHTASTSRLPSIGYSGKQQAPQHQRAGVRAVRRRRRIRAPPEADSAAAHALPGPPCRHRRRLILLRRRRIRSAGACGSSPARVGSRVPRMTAPAPRWCPQKPARCPRSSSARSDARPSSRPSGPRETRRGRSPRRSSGRGTCGGTSGAPARRPPRPRAGRPRSSPGPQAARCRARRSCRQAASTAASFPGRVSAPTAVCRDRPRTSAPPPQVMMSRDPATGGRCPRRRRRRPPRSSRPAPARRLPGSGRPSVFKASTSAMIPRVWGTMIAFAPFCTSAAACAGSIEPDSVSTSADERNQSPCPGGRGARGRAPAPGGSPRPPPGGPGPPARRKRRGSPLARETPPGVAEEVARAGHEVARDLPGTDLVRDDAGQDAAHVLAFHRRPENWYCHLCGVPLRRVLGAGPGPLSTPRFRETVRCPSSGTNRQPMLSRIETREPILRAIDQLLRAPSCPPPGGRSPRCPPSCSRRAAGTSGAAAVTRILSNGAFSGHPSLPSPVRTATFR